MNHVDYAKAAFLSVRKDITLPNNKVLDVGCRNFVLKEFFEDRLMDWTGLDPHPEEAGIVEGKMEYIPLHDEIFGLVFACHSFEHCERPVDALREFKRVLVKDGVLFLVLPPPTRHHILEADSDHIFCLSPAHLARLFHYTGFKNIRTGLYPGHDEDSASVIAWGVKE